MDEQSMKEMKMKNRLLFMFVIVGIGLGVSCLGWAQNVDILRSSSDVDLLLKKIKRQYEIIGTMKNEDEDDKSRFLEKIRKKDVRKYEKNIEMIRRNFEENIFSDNEYAKKIKEHEKTILWLINKRDFNESLWQDEKVENEKLDNEIDVLNKRIFKNANVFAVEMEKLRRVFQLKEMGMIEKLERVTEEMAMIIRENKEAVISQEEKNRRIIELKEGIIVEMDRDSKILEDRVGFIEAEKQRFEKDVKELSILLEDTESDIPKKIKEKVDPLEKIVSQTKEELQKMYLVIESQKTLVSELRSEVGILEMEKSVDRSVQGDMKNKLTKFQVIKTENERLISQLDIEEKNRVILEDKVNDQKLQMDDFKSDLARKIKHVKDKHEKKMREKSKEFDVHREKMAELRDKNKVLENNKEVMYRQLKIRSEETDKLQKKVDVLSAKSTDVVSSLEKDFVKKENVWILKMETMETDLKKKVAVEKNNQEKTSLLNRKNSDLEMELKTMNRLLQKQKETMGTMEKKWNNGNHDEILVVEKEMKKWKGEFHKLEKISQSEKDRFIQLEKNTDLLAREKSNLEDEMVTMNALIQDQNNRIISIKKEGHDEVDNADLLAGKEIKKWKEKFQMLEQKTMGENNNAQQLEKNIDLLTREKNDLERELGIFKGKDRNCAYEMGDLRTKLYEVTVSAKKECDQNIDAKMGTIGKTMQALDGLVTNQENEIKKLQTQLNARVEDGSYLQEKNKEYLVKLNSMESRFKEACVNERSVWEDKKRDEMKSLRIELDEKIRALEIGDLEIKAVSLKMRKIQDRAQDIVLEKTDIENELFICQDEMNDVKKSMKKKMSEKRSPFKKERDFFKAQLNILEVELSMQDKKHEKSIQEKNDIQSQYVLCIEETDTLRQSLKDLETVLIER